MLLLKAIEDIGYDTLQNPVLSQITLIEKGGDYIPRQPSLTPL